MAVNQQRLRRLEALEEATGGLDRPELDERWGVAVAGWSGALRQRNGVTLPDGGAADVLTTLDADGRTVSQLVFRGVCLDCTVGACDRHPYVPPAAPPMAVAPSAGPQNGDEQPPPAGAPVPFRPPSGPPPASPYAAMIGAAADAEAEGLDPSFLRRWSP